MRSSPLTGFGSPSELFHGQQTGHGGLGKYMESAKTIFRQYLKAKGMLQSQQRDQILDVFLQTERHLTIDDLYELVRKKNAKISPKLASR